MHFSPRNMSIFVRPLQTALDNAHTHTVIKRVSEAFTQFANGITNNPSVSVAALLIYAHKVISSVLANEDASSSSAMSARGGRTKRTHTDTHTHEVAAASSRPLRRSKEDVIRIVKAPEKNRKGVLTTNGNRDIVLTFGLQLVLFGLKHKKLTLQGVEEEMYEVSIRDDEGEEDDTKEHDQSVSHTSSSRTTTTSLVSVSVLEMLDPYVSLLTECVRPSRCLSNRVVHAVIKCLCYLLRVPLPSLRTHIGALITFFFNTIQQHTHSGAGAAHTHTSQSCMHAIAIAIRHCPYIHLTERQLRTLVTHIKHSITHTTTTRSLSLLLLKSILYRKLLCAEVYDTMKEVQHLLIHTHMPHIQTRCIALLVRFLLDYPLSPKRLQQHFHFLMNNLRAYPYAQGRAAVLNVLMYVCVCVCVCVFVCVYVCMYVCVCVGIRTHKEERRC